MFPPLFPGTLFTRLVGFCLDVTLLDPPFTVGLELEFFEKLLFLLLGTFRVVGLFVASLEAVGLD